MERRERSSSEKRRPAWGRAFLRPGAWVLALVVPAGCADRQQLQSAPPAGVVQPAPAMRIVDLGRSTQGRSLTLYVFGEVPPRPTEPGPARARESLAPVLIIGGIHGSEPTGAEVAARLAEFLRAHPDQRMGRTVAVLPQANPDGLARGTRGNANGVDVNRNFPARNWRKTPAGESHGGPAPASEAETRAVIRAVEMLRPGAIVSVHSISTNEPCNNYDGPAAELANLMAERNGYPVKASIGYPTPGSFGSWAGVDRQIQVITLEFPRSLRGAQCWEQNRAALLTAVAGDRLPRLPLGK